MTDSASSNLRNAFGKLRRSADRPALGRPRRRVRARAPRRGVARHDSSSASRSPRAASALVEALRVHCAAALAGAPIEFSIVERDRRARRSARAEAVAGSPQPDRRRLRQGRRRQVDGGRELRARAGGRRSEGRLARRRHLRPEPAAHAGSHGPAARDARRQDARAARRARHRGHVDRLPRRRAAADGLARADGHVGAEPAPDANALGRSRLSDRRHAARARATFSSRSRSACPSAARSSSRRRKTSRSRMPAKGSRCSRRCTCRCSASSRT